MKKICNITNTLKPNEKIIRLAFFVAPFFIITLKFLTKRNVSTAICRSSEFFRITKSFIMEYHTYKPS